MSINILILGSAKFLARTLDNINQTHITLFLPETSTLNSLSSAACLHRSRTDLNSSYEPTLCWTARSLASFCRARRWSCSIAERSSRSSSTKLMSSGSAGRAIPTTSPLPMGQQRSTEVTGRLHKWYTRPGWWQSLKKHVSACRCISGSITYFKTACLYKEVQGSKKVPSWVLTLIQASQHNNILSTQEPNLLISFSTDILLVGAHII